MNSECVYYPQKKSMNENMKISFKINDFMRDAISVPDSIKTYKKLITVPDINGNTIVNNGEYSKRIEDSEIYKKYTTDFKPNETKMLDQNYADLFDSSKISGLELDEIHKKVSTKMEVENRRHNLVKYFAIHNIQVPYLSDEFAKYFSTLINAYKSSPSQLDTIKTFFYKLVGPSYVQSQLIEHYKTNMSLYSSKDDILYILNTTKEYLEAVKMDDLERTPTNMVYVFKDDKRNFEDNTLSVDSLTLFAMGSLLMNLYPLIQGKTCPFISMTNAEFSVMLEAYLKKKYPESKSSSVIVFAMNPNNAPNIP